MVEKVGNLTAIFDPDDATNALILTILVIIILLLPLIAHHIYKSRIRKRKEIIPFVIEDEKDNEKD